MGGRRIIEDVSLYMVLPTRFTKHDLRIQEAGSLREMQDRWNSCAGDAVASGQGFSVA